LAETYGYQEIETPVFEATAELCLKTDNVDLQMKSVYQAGRAYQYRTLFPAMIADWRKNWGEGDFPFLFVQLAPGTSLDDDNLVWGTLSGDDNIVFPFLELGGVGGICVHTHVVGPQVKEQIAAFRAGARGPYAFLELRFVLLNLFGLGLFRKLGHLLFQMLTHFHVFLRAFLERFRDHLVIRR